MAAERASLKTFILSVSLFAVLLAAAGAAAWIYFGIGAKVFPATTVFHTGNVNLVVFSALVVALALLYFFYPQASSDLLSQVVIGAAVIAVAVLTAPSLTRTGERDLLAPLPEPERFHSVTGGTLYWLGDGSSVYLPENGLEMRPIVQTAYHPERYVFLHDDNNLVPAPSQRWLGPRDASVYFQPPAFLRDLFNDFHFIAAAVKNFLARPTDIFNLAVFFLGLLSLVFGPALAAELRLPRLLRLVIAAVILRVLILLIRYSWWEAPAILGMWTEVPASFAWLAGGWMPLAAALFFLMIKSYNLSLVSLRESEND